MSYENFIKRAHKSIRTNRNGADAGVMQALINHENGTARSGNLDKQLAKTNNYIGKALDKFLTFKLTEAEKAGLLQLKIELESAYSSEQIMRIVEKGLELTQRFKEY